MAKADVINIQGEKVGEVELNDAVWGTDVRPYLIHDVVVMQLNNRRRGTASAKTRGEVSGGGKKPWRQKGTGRARAGSSTSPVWVGGGVVFPPKPKEYNMSVPKKVRKAALRSALTVRFEGSALKVLDKLELPAISTKNFAGIMKTLNLSKPLVVVGGKNETVEKSARNIPYTKILRAEGLNVYDIIRHDQLVVTVDAVQKIEEALSS
ncbi:MAG: 50S ribosomal protein L4 [Syntrophorhabdaceae bacterium PtaU1.Bin034]|nr:MAG: 50S ribosomal protein L4 [Syntrophorhabdaceae bacterium PtaU1.Bin034]